SALAARQRIEGGGHLPLGLARQAPACPATIRRGLVPVHVHDGVPGAKGHEHSELTLVPAAIVPPCPEERARGPLAPQPGPALPIPELPPTIPVVLDERLKLRIGDWCRPDAEWAHLDGMRPLLVVEYEWLLRRSPEEKRPAGNRDITRLVPGVDRW